MTDGTYRPTMTFPNGGYNASQVRLYGIVADSSNPVRTIEAGSPKTFDVTTGDFQVTVTVLKDGKSGGAISTSYLTIEMKKLGTVIMAATMSADLAARTGNTISVGVIQGYAFEGHTYDLPRPKIMILPVAPLPSIPVDDSGYDKKQPENYAVWLVDKLDECAEFELNQGFVEQLVLDANLPGKRAPNVYIGRMMLGHRGGKLTD